MNFSNFWRLIRAHEWWNYKIPLALGLAYALAWHKKIPFESMVIPTTLIILVGFSAGIYASVFNDFMDLKQDSTAGKQTPMMGFCVLHRRLIIVASLTLNALVAVFLFYYLNLHLSFTIFLLIWIIYTAYSLPPVRLKERSIFGVLAIAVGEHVLATLISLSIVCEFTKNEIPASFTIYSCIWALCFGCRGILWHQLCDLDNDRKTECKTMGVVLGPVTLERLGNFVVFPIEIISFITLLTLTGNWLAWLFLPIHLLLEWLRIKDMKSNLIIVKPSSNARFALFEYYQIFFPLTVLSSALTRDYYAGLLIMGFCLLFLKPIALTFIHTCHFIYWRFFTPAYNLAKKFLLVN